jgi:hypothetical protein
LPIHDLADIERAIARYRGIPKDRRSRHALRDLFEQFQPFFAIAVFKIYVGAGIESDFM